MADLKGKTILVGVTGGIAAYKMPNLVSILVQKGADVHVLLSEDHPQSGGQITHRCHQPSFRPHRAAKKSPEDS